MRQSMDGDAARSFAREWVKAWNEHDLEGILSHYAEDVVFHSPRIRMVTGRDVDSVNGKGELRAYWSQALERMHDLRFELGEVLVGSDAMTILYTNQRGQSVAETFVFGGDGTVVRSIAAYAGEPSVSTG